jgi:hypothetical protein
MQHTDQPCYQCCARRPASERKCHALYDARTKSNVYRLIAEPKITNPHTVDLDREKTDFNLDGAEWAGEVIVRNKFSANNFCILSELAQANLRYAIRPVPDLPSRVRLPLFRVHRIENHDTDNPRFSPLRSTQQCTRGAGTRLRTRALRLFHRGKRRSSLVRGVE